MNAAAYRLICLLLLFLLLPLAQAQEGLPLSGLWFDPVSDGDGFNVIQSEAGTTVLFFGYNANGGHDWLISNTESDPIGAGDTIVFQMSVGGTGSFETPAPPAELQNWGTMTLQVVDCDTVVFELNGQDGIKRWDAIKLAGIEGPDDSACDLIPTETMVLSSSVFDSSTPIPPRHSCAGVDVAPPMNWSGVPPNAERLALVMDDINAPCGTGPAACRHWQVYNLPPTVTELADSQDLTQIEGVVLGAAYNLRNEYAGPCPPNQHTYTFTLYALSESMPILESGLLYSRSLFESLFEEHIINSASVTGFFP